MPLYQCVVPAGSVAPELRPRLAGALTRVHCDTTGAPSRLVQVLFMDVPRGAAFTGDQPSSLSSIAGYIRAGRPADVRARLFRGIRDAWVEVTGLPVDQLKITLFDVPASWIMHGGKMMPEPGQDGDA